MVTLRGLVDFEPNQGNPELKLKKIAAKYNFEGFQRKKIEKIRKGSQTDSVSFLHRMDNFLTSDTSEVVSYEKCTAYYYFINDGTTVLRKERFQI